MDDFSSFSVSTYSSVWPIFLFFFNSDLTNIQQQLFIKANRTLCQILNFCQLYKYILYYFGASLFLPNRITNFYVGFFFSNFVSCFLILSQGQINFLCFEFTKIYTLNSFIIKFYKICKHVSLNMFPSWSEVLIKIYFLLKGFPALSVKFFNVHILPIWYAIFIVDKFSFVLE